MRLKGFEGQHLTWYVNLIGFFSFSTKTAIKLHTNSYILPPKWSALEPGWPVQQLRDLVRGTVISLPNERHQLTIGAIGTTGLSRLLAVYEHCS